MNVPHNTTEYFLGSYKECRAAFKAAAKTGVQAFPHSVRTVIKISKEAGSIDTLLLMTGKRRAKRLILLSSGVHGVEGFVGSAVQRKILDELVSGSLRVKSDVLFLHGINPHGFQHRRRTNERNVDLNRNFFFKREKIPKREKNLGYRELVSFFMPGFPFTFWPLEFFIFVIRFGGILLRVGARRFTDAAVNGQFEFKRGIYYGGRKPERVVKRMRKFFKETLPDYDEILHVDIHTGYGEENGLLLIQNADLGTPEDTNIRKISEGLPILRPDSDKNFYKTAGDFTDFLSRVFPQKKGFFPLTLELGTTGNLNLWGAIRSSFIVVAENRIHHQGAWFPATRRTVREKFLHLFYPASYVWRQTALKKSVDTCRALFQRFESLD